MVQSVLALNVTMMFYQVDICVLIFFLISYNFCVKKPNKYVQNLLKLIAKIIESNNNFISQIVTFLCKTLVIQKMDLHKACYMLAIYLLLFNIQ